MSSDFADRLGRLGQRVKARDRALQEAERRREDDQAEFMRGYLERQQEVIHPVLERAAQVPALGGRVEFGEDDTTLTVPRKAFLRFKPNTESRRVDIHEVPLSGDVARARDALRDPVGSYALSELEQARVEALTLDFLERTVL